MTHFILLSLLVAVVSQTGGSAQGPRAALIIVDVQTCFLSGGSLAVTDGDDVIPVINRIRQQFGGLFSLVVLSQDWHCPTHVSFASSHPGKNVLDVVPLKYQSDGTLCLGGSISKTNFPNATTCQGDRELDQVLWPVHCVQDVTTGPTSSNLADSLDRASSDVIIRKGSYCEIDSYSLFFDNGGIKSTGLEHTFRAAGIDTVFVTGLALDYCVYYTSLDARKLGFNTYTVLDASRGVADETVQTAKLDMSRNGVNLINSQDIDDVMDSLRRGTDAGSIKAADVMGLFMTTLTAILLAR
ncbi:nicotinamidase [Aplysia californica]|uniref:nicotinamidase n=1 Tax=Aplysia californica TaxID=6500 RepID=A0ABM1A0N3_APLCA|nr:nicotinamidase [Aplysia californica]